MKIFLLNPPGPNGRAFTREGRCTQAAGVWGTTWPPLSLATCAALLEKDGHQARILDAAVANRHGRAVTHALRAFAPDLVAWTTGTPTMAHDLALGEKIKRIRPQAFTCVLGTHVSALPGEALAADGVDAVIRGEPERPLSALATAGLANLRSIKGLSFRSERKIIHTPSAAPLEASRLPAPAWRLLDVQAYRLPLKGRPFLMVAPIRGCPYACSFCTAPLYYGRRLRKRPVVHVLDEIEANVVQHGVRDVFVWADTFTADRGYVLDLCDGMKERGLHIAWTCNSRVDTVDRDMLARMRRAGCWMVSFGLESASREILDRCGKGITVDQSRAAVFMAHDAGLCTSGHFILGLPGETRATMAATLDLALGLPLDVAQFYAASPFPGTRLFREAVENGWIRRTRPASQGRAVMDLPGLPAEAVDGFRRAAYRRFYGRPRALSNLATMIDPRMLLHAGANLRGVLHWMQGTR